MSNETYDLDTIHAAIPHRAPFLLVDKIVSWEENSIVCEKTFPADEYFFAGHYPDFPLVPGVMLCEAGMQAGAIMLSRHFKELGDRAPVATRLNDVRFKRIVRPDELIRLEVELKEQLANAFFMKAKVTVDGKVAARFEFACTAAKTS